MKYILSIILLIFIQSDWIENIEKSISRINQKGKLENEFEKKDKREQKFLLSGNRDL